MVTMLYQCWNSLYGVGAVALGRAELTEEGGLNNSKMVLDRQNREQRWSVCVCAHVHMCVYAYMCM